MKELKDNFSAQASTYASYRPVYPKELYNFLFAHVHAFGQAWDCGTGNGQAAVALAERFEKVYATDISNKQLANATQKPNIIYKNLRAEATDFPDNSFDLVTVAQAIHWFDFDRFYNEVIRVAKNNALIAIWTYTLLQVSEEIDKVLEDFYYNITGPYWDKERKYVDEEYKTIPFPFKEIATPPLSIQLNWNFDQLIGYLNSWSSVQHYIRQKQTNPVNIIFPALERWWPEGAVKEITFPVFMRAGLIIKV